MITLIRKKKKLIKSSSLPKESLDILSSKSHGQPLVQAGEVEAVLLHNDQGKPYLYMRKGDEEIYRFLLENFHEGAINISQDRSIIYCNKKFSEMIKSPKNKIIGASIFEFVSNNQFKQLESFLTSIESHPAKHAFRLISSDNSKKDVFFVGQPIKTEGNVGISVIIIDMTKYKLAEKKRRKALLDLAKLNKELQKANKAKSFFLANMSHELRSPLNCIIGFTDLMYKDKVGAISKAHKEYLKEIAISSHHLLCIINNILDLSKIESGHMELHPALVNITKLITEVIKTMEPLLHKKNIQCAVDIDKIVVSQSIITDSDRFKQILYNYLSNAIKFTSINGKINVNVYPQNKKFFRLEIKDNGIGIKKRDISELFTMFKQLKMDTTKLYQGIGLGLALTRHLAKGLGGEVGVQSKLGKGSIFFAILPYKLGKHNY